MNRDSALRIVALFPALLGTYGDGGNVLILSRRARWRDIPVEVLTVGAGDPVPADGDVYVIGGGEDGAQMAAMAALRATDGQKSALARALDRGAQMLAVCAGLQLLGESFLDRTGAETAGLGLLDARTSRLPVRAVGELLADAPGALGLPPLSGFENHGGHTVLGPAARPLATVRRGVGNGPDPAGGPAGEGALTDRIVATYLHGPVLARNPALADFVLARALGVGPDELAPLDVPEHAALRARVGADS